MSPEINPFTSESTTTDSKQKIDFEQYEELQTELDEEWAKIKAMQDEMTKLETWM